MLPPRTRQQYDIDSTIINKEQAEQSTSPPPRPIQQYDVDIDSIIINKEQAQWISSQIVESTRRPKPQKNQRASASVKQDDETLTYKYEFTLLYRQSRDGNTPAKFRELCNDKGPTIAVGKVLGTEEILGGYNSFAWGSEIVYVDALESFIFA